MNRERLHRYSLLLATLLLAPKHAGASTQFLAPLDGAMEASRESEVRAMLMQGAGVVRATVALARTTMLPDATVIVLNLFADKSLRAVREELKTHTAMQGWHGRIEGEPGSSVTIYFRGKWMTGRVALGDFIYTIDADTNGVAKVTEVDSRKLQSEVDVRRVRK